MKRIFAIIASFLLIGLFFQLKPQVVHAQYYNQYLSPDTNPDVPQNMHTTVQSLIINGLASINCFLAGYDPLTSDHRCLGIDNSTGKIGFVNQNGGMLGFMVKGIALTYNLPVHTQYYSQYLSQNFHFLSNKVYADTGVGFNSLNPLLQIWVGFRNGAYLFVVIIFIVLGFLIMFRIKIDPRTVMSIQNQIPKIIIGLLAITFSFAIAGILIDFMYVITFVLLGIIQNAVKGIVAIDPTTLTGYSQPFQAADALLPGGMAGAAAGGAYVLHSAITSVLNSNLLGGIATVITAVLLIIPNLLIGVICGIAGWVTGNGCAFGDPGDVLGAAGGGTITLIIWITLLISIMTALFRFWVALVTCYITILFNIILGPIRILFGMVPSGPGGGLTGWIKDLIANLAVFPVSISFLALAGAIATAIGKGQGAFTPYLIPGTGVSGILGFVAILMLPKIPDQVKEWFKVKDSALGSAVGQGLASGIGFVGGTGKRLGGTVRNTVFRAPDPYRHIQAGVGWKFLNPTAGAGGATIKMPVFRQAQQAINWTRRTAGGFALKQIGINPRSFKDYNDTAGAPVTQKTDHHA